MQAEELPSSPPQTRIPESPREDRQLARRRFGQARLLLDIGTIDAAGEAQLLTDGLAGHEQRPACHA